MNQKEPFPRRSFLNWLGLGLLGLMVFGLLRLTQDDQPAALLSRTSPAQESPLPGTLTATLVPTDPSSPLPSSTAVPESLVAASSPLAPSPVQPAGSDHFQLTVLHTNDTWGYLNPCG